MQPDRDGARHSPLGDVLLTNADLDHVLGLFQLRELGHGLRVHCTSAVRETLSRSLRLDSLLSSFCGIEWHELSYTFGSLLSLAYRALDLGGKSPRYDNAVELTGGQSVALEFLEPRTNRKLVIAPDVATITPELQSALESADAVLFDGTFWSENELREVHNKARTASEMGHIPIADGSLEVLRNLSARHRMYVHINNTNPIFLPGTSERSAVENAGIAIAEDGMEFEL